MLFIEKKPHRHYCSPYLLAGTSKRFLHQFCCLFFIAKTSIWPHISCKTFLKYITHPYPSLNKASGSELSVHHVVGKLQGEYHILQLLAALMTARHYSHSGIMHNTSTSSLMHEPFCMKKQNKMRRNKWINNSLKCAIKCFQNIEKLLFWGYIIKW